MDFSNFKVSDWLMAGGGLAMLILGFVLPWSSVSFAGVSDRNILSAKFVHRHFF